MESFFIQKAHSASAWMIGIGHSLPVGSHRSRLTYPFHHECGDVDISTQKTLPYCCSAGEHFTLPHTQKSRTKKKIDFDLFILVYSSGLTRPSLSIQIGPRGLFFYRKYKVHPPYETFKQINEAFIRGGDSTLDSLTFPKPQPSNEMDTLCTPLCFYYDCQLCSGFLSLFRLKWIHKISVVCQAICITRSEQRNFEMHYQPPHRTTRRSHDNCISYTVVVPGIRVYSGLT